MCVRPAARPARPPSCTLVCTTEIPPHPQSDGGYEMGNCATTLREGLQCPHGSVFLYNLGCVRAMAARLVRSSARWRARRHRHATLCTLRYDDTYVWGNALAADQERPTMCIFEAPDNEALFQHAKEYYEGLPGSSLYVRNVLTVGNYDYTQVSAGSPRRLGQHAAYTVAPQSGAALDPHSP